VRVTGVVAVLYSSSYHYYNNYNMIIRRCAVVVHRHVVGASGAAGALSGGVGGNAAAATRRVCALPTVRSVFFLFTSAGHDGLQTARSMHRLAAHDPTTTWCSKVRRSHNFYLNRML